MKTLAPNICQDTSGTIYFYQQVGKKRAWINLETKDFSTAVKRTAEIRSNPLARPHRGLVDDAREFIKHRKEQRKYSPSSANAKLCTLEAFCAWAPKDATMGNVSKALVQKYYDYLRLKKKRYSKSVLITESTAQGYMMTLRSFFRWAIEVKRARVANPVEKMDFGQIDRRSKKPWVRRDQKDALIKKAPDDELRFILYCGFDAGLRREEIVEARRDWFDLKQGVIHVQKADRHRIQDGEREFLIKDREDRSIPMTAPFRAFLTEYLSELKPLEFALYPDAKHGKWRYRYDFRRPFTQYMVAQKMAWVNPHTMRRSFASILVTGGVSIYKVSDWLGDKVDVVQNNYGYLEPVDDDIHALTGLG